MRKFYLFNWMLLLIGMISSTAFGQGTETFESQTALKTSYDDGSFAGETSGVTVNYIHSRDQETYPINGKGLMLRRSDEPSSVTFNIPNGVGDFTFEYRKAYTGGSERIISILVDGIEVAQTPSFGSGSGAQSTVYTYTVPVNKDGNVAVTLTFPSGTATGNRQITIDNISWTANEVVANEPPVITPMDFTAKVGDSGDYTVAVTNNPTEWTQTGLLPAGITFTDGVFNGNYTQAGTFSAVLTATNDAGPGADATFTWEIAKGDQTLTLANQNLVLGSVDVTLPATTEQGFAVTYTSANSAIASVSGNTLTAVALGSTSITATATGDANYENFSTTFDVVVSDAPIVYNGQGTFEKVTSVDDLTDGYYVVANETSEFVMTNVNSGNVFVPEDANLTNNTFVNPSTSIVWKIETNGSGKTIYNEVSEKYVGWNSGNSASEESTVSDKSRWTFSYADDKFTVKNIATPARQLSYNSQNPRFAAYGNAGQEELQLYKLVGSSSNTTWNGTAWSNGAPDETKDAILEASFDGDITAKSLTVIADVDAVVPTGSTYTITNDITVEGSLTFADGAYLIQENPDAVNTGSVSFEKQVTDLFRLDAVLFSSPVAGQTLQAFAPLTNKNDFFNYDETLNDWVMIPGAQVATQTFDEAVLTLVRAPRTSPYYQGNEGSPTTTDHVFTGTLQNGTITKAVTANGEGYNPVGNPYGSALNLNTFFADNANVEAVHIWTHNYHLPAPGGTRAGSNWVAKNRTGSSLPDTDLLSADDLAVGQGFFVKVSTAGTVEFNNNQRSNASTELLRTNQNENKFWLGLSKEDQKLNTILVGYVEGATNGYDANYDAKDVVEASSYIYSIIEEANFVIDGRAAQFDQTDVVKLAFKADQATTYSIDLASTKGIFAEGQTVYLIDKVLNKVHDLSTAYTFSTEAGIFNDRFEVRYENRDLGLGNDLTKAKDVVVYSNNNTIVVESKDAKLLAVELIDLQGRTVFGKSNINANSYSIQTAAKGVLIVKIQTAEGKIITKKVIKK